MASLCDEMMGGFLPRANVEFIQDFAWRLPMRLIIRLLGFPEKDFEQIKWWCVDGIKALSPSLNRNIVCDTSLPLAFEVKKTVSDTALDNAA